MSTNDKANQGSTERTDQQPTGSPAEMTDTGQDDSAVGPIILFFIFGLVASLVVGWVVFPQLLYSQKQQPVAFNHALHNEEVDEDCESCHFFRDDGSYAGVPKLAQCVECHEEVLGDSETERIFVEEYVAKEREVPWLIYSRQPDCVFFSHAAHVKMAEMECVTCHGSGYSIDIWGRNIAGIKRNTWDRMKMDDCAECHREKNVNQGSVQTLKGGCLVCHK
jgi:hypothetical protein